MNQRDAFAVRLRENGYHLLLTSLSVNQVSRLKLLGEVRAQHLLRHAPQPLALHTVAEHGGRPRRAMHTARNTAARRRLAPLSPLAPVASLAARARARAMTRAPLHATLLAALGGERGAALELGDRDLAALELGDRDLVRLERRREVGRRDLG